MLVIKLLYCLFRLVIFVVFQGSDKGEKMEASDGLDSEMKDFAEVVVDIETIESTEENSIAKFRASAIRRNQHLR